MDIQATSEIIKWIMNMITIILIIVAASKAVKKKNNLCLGVAILGNLVAFYFTKSPLLCWIISIACIIWALSAKKSEQNKQPLKTSKTSINHKENLVNHKEKMATKPGPIIGLIIGALLMFFPIMGFMTHEASLSDSKGQMMGFGFIIFGAIMFIINIICLIKGTDNLLASAPEAATNVSHVKHVSKEKSDEAPEKDMVRCRFCGKKYSSEYNGCPHCKKK